MIYKNKIVFSLLVLVSSFTFAQDNGTPNDGIKDPLKFINKPIFKFNDILDNTLLTPIAKVYETVIPSPVKKGVSNFFRNLKEPINIINYTAQGNGYLAAKSTARLLVNTTIGLGGIMDIASTDDKLKYSNTDFGQTLGVWGINSGPYLVLPILGPSTLRDSAGLFIIDLKLMPQTYITPIAKKNQLISLEIIDTKQEILKYQKILDEVTFGDKYDTIRNAYLQRRQYLIDNIED